MLSTSYYNQYDFNNRLCSLGFNSSVIQRYLYHYTRHYEAIKSDFRFYNRFGMSDRQECQYVFNLCLRYSKSILKGTNIPHSKFESCCKETLERLKKELNVFSIYQISLCLNGNSNYMWQKYATRSGGCLVFEQKAFIDSMRSQLIQPTGDGKLLVYGRVIYKRKSQIRILKKIAKDFSMKYDYSHADINSYEFYLLMSMIACIGIFFKKSSYKKECEYKIAFDLVVSPNGDIQGIYSPRHSDYHVHTDENNKQYISINFNENSLLSHKTWERRI